MLGCRHTVSLDQDLQRIFLNLPGWEKHSCCWSQVWAEFKKQKLIWDQRLEPETACSQVPSSHIFSHFSSINLFVSWIKIQQSGWWETLLGQESCFYPTWMGKWKNTKISTTMLSFMSTTHSYPFIYQIVSAGFLQLQPLIQGQIRTT